MSLSAKELEAKSWFQKALDGIQAAEILLAANTFLPDEISFHCQQSIEKSLKGFRFWHGFSFLNTHDLNVLSADCITVDRTLDPLLKMAAPLTQYAVVYRYPGPVVHASPAEVSAMIDLAKEIYEQLLRRLPRSIRI